MDEWSWVPGFKNLMFLQLKETVVVYQNRPEGKTCEVDRFRCRAHTVKGRLRACYGWMKATQWVQPPLSDDLLSFVK